MDDQYYTDYSYLEWYHYYFNDEVPDLPCMDTLHQDVQVNIKEDDVTYCNSSFDSVICWPTTKAGEYATVRCPSHFGDLVLDTEGSTSKFCFANGTWKKADYSGCIIDTSDALHNLIIRVIIWLGYTTSTVALLTALFLFCYFRSLWCIRNSIHCHLMVTFILRNILWIIMHLSLVSINDFIEQNVDRSVILAWTCQIVMMCYNYLMSASFYWMLVEGLYLHTMIVWALSADRVKLWKYALLGWGGPLVFIFAWAVVKATLDNNTCWLPDKSSYNFIFMAPIMLILLINLLFLASIEYVLITKLKASNHLATRQYKKAVKGTVILLPLLGVIFVIMITPPGNNTISKTVFKYFNAILQSSQGMLVSIFYCFLNGEVRYTVKNRFIRWRDSRSVYTRSRGASIIQKGATECTSMLQTGGVAGGGKNSPVNSIKDRETSENEGSNTKGTDTHNRLSSGMSETTYVSMECNGSKACRGVPYSNDNGKAKSTLDSCVETHVELNELDNDVTYSL